MIECEVKIDEFNYHTWEDKTLRSIFIDRRWTYISHERGRFIQIWFKSSTFRCSTCHSLQIIIHICIGCLVQDIGRCLCQATSNLGISETSYSIVQAEQTLDVGTSARSAPIEDKSIDIDGAPSNNVETIG